ncbi:MAG: putative Zn-dependent protease [Candidatus Promineifilaceae bacterium]|jgi:predicted Zn-dependent protease
MTMSRFVFSMAFSQSRSLGLLACLAVLLLNAGCATNPVTGKSELRFVSEDREVAIGQAHYIHQQQAQGGPYLTQPAINAYVQSIGAKLVEVSDRKQLPFEFVVLNNSVPNAWALPGGKIAINRGLLTELKSEAELAAVIGHEIVHVAARHGAKSMERGGMLQAGLMGLGLAVDDHDYRDYILLGANVSTMLVTMKYGRGAELEADAYGIKYMVAAGYDPHAAVELQQTFLRLANGNNPGWISGLLASHPPSKERIVKNAESAQTYPRGGFRGESEYRKMMEPLLAATPAYDALEKGYIALNKRDHDGALSFVSKGLAVEPDEAHLYGLKAKALSAKGDARQSVAALDTAIKLNNQYFEFFLLRGKFKKNLGDLAGAKQDLERSTSMMPTASAHLQLGVMARAAGRSADAIVHFRMASQSESPDGVQAFQSLAQLDMPSNPGRYLDAQIRVNDRGMVVVGVVNKTPVDVAECSISVYSPTQRRWLPYRFRGGIPQGTVQYAQTPIGPYADDQVARQQVRIRFDRVTPGGH